MFFVVRTQGPELSALSRRKSGSHCEQAIEEGAYVFPFFSKRSTLLPPRSNKNVPTNRDSHNIIVIDVPTSRYRVPEEFQGARCPHAPRSAVRRSNHQSVYDSFHAAWFDDG